MAEEANQTPSSKIPQDWVYLENDQVRLGLLRSHGGAIAYFSAADSNENMLNHFDYGRLVQQSYYGDPDGSTWVDKDWNYNPVQGGSYDSKPAVVEELRATSTTAYARSIPRNWAGGQLLDECRMEQWVELDGPVAIIRFRFEYRGNTEHDARHQETPAVFVDKALDTLVRYEGDAPWTGGELTRHVPDWPNESCRLDENWAAWVGEDGRGIGIFVPGTTEATCYRYISEGDASCSYIAPVRTFALKPGLRFEYMAYLTHGTVEVMRNRFEALRAESTPR